MTRDLPSGAGGIISYFTRHNTLANLVLVVLLLLGAMALPRMHTQFFPDTVVDNITVTVAWRGAGAEDIDAAIVQVLEPVLMTVEGVTSAESVSREGNARISLEFEPNWDMGRGNEDVQTALNLITTLPAEADEPMIRRSNWRDRVTDVIITGPVGKKQLGLFTDEFIARLFDEGITKTTIRGIADPQTVVEVSTLDLISNDISMAQIAAAIAEEVDADPAGDVGKGTSRIRTGVEKRSAEDIAAIVLKSNVDGTKLTVGDIALVYEEPVDRLRAYFVGDQPAMSVRVDRSSSGDAIGIQHQVEKVAEEMMLTLPEGTKITLIRTRAEMISARIGILVDNGLTGLMLVVALLFLFLNARTAFWVAAGIPAAMLAALAAMYMVGITINMISLFALIITLGIVVDDAIVVGEHADFRARRGEPPVIAAERAAQYMAMPVFAATLTTVIAFFGLTAISGRFGDLISDIPFTVIVVLSASLLECFLILPHHMSHALVHAAKDHWYDAPSRFVNRGFDWLRDNIFSRIIALVITARYVVVAGAVVLLLSQVVLFMNGSVQWRFFNAPERSSVTGNFSMVSGATREDSLAMMRELQRATDEIVKDYTEKYGRSPVEFVLAEIGGNSGRPLPGVESKTEDQLGGIAIELIDPDLRPYSSRAFVADLQDRVQAHPLAEVVSFRGWGSGPGGDALDVQFYGADAKTLKAASEALKRALDPYPAVSGIEDDLAYDKEEWVLELNDQGRALGLSIDSLGRVLRHRLNGIEAATYPLGPRSAEIRVELAEDELTADFLERMQIRTPAGHYIALADIVTVSRSDGFSTVRRENGLRIISVTGDISEDDPVAANEVAKALEDEILPEIVSRYQVDFRMSGLAEQENTFLNDARLGLILCLVGIYLALTWIFASWTRPVVVMAIIPFGLVGAIWGHYIWEVPLSMFSIVGLLGMTGIIINDSIVLVTTIDGLAKERGLIPSIIEGASDRLRPVFLTTMTTVLGLAPLLYEKSSQAQFLKPTVITLSYGLGFGMLLVLLLVPALIAIQLDVKRIIQSTRRSTRRRASLVFALSFGGGALMLGWLWATLGHQAIYGTMLVTGLGSGMTGALMTYGAGVFVLCLALYVIGGVTFAVSRMRKV